MLDLHQDPNKQTIAALPAILSKGLSGRLSPRANVMPTIVITFKEGDLDLDNPINWSKKRKRFITAVAFYNFLIVGFNSSIITTDFDGVAEEFQSPEIAAMMIFFIFVIGFSLGPMVFSPLSEAYGRRKIYRYTLVPAVVFIIPCALARNYTMLLICRFISGFLFGAPLTLCGATISDIWVKSERGLYLMYFTSAPLVGLVAGPLVGGFVAETWDWRALYWVQFIGSCAAALAMWFVPETYAPQKLKDRAKLMSSQDPTCKFVTTDHNDMYSSLISRLATQLKTPFKMLCRESILTFMAVFVAMLFGEIYMLFISLPLIFMDCFGFSRSEAGLCFTPAGLGVICGVLPSGLLNKWYKHICAQYDKRCRAAHDLDLERNLSVSSEIFKLPGPPSPPQTSSSNPSTASLQHYPPELRLIPMLCFSPIVAISILLLSFTSIPDSSPFPNHSLWLPGVALFLFGFAIVTVLNSANAYIADCYSGHVASAFAGVTLLRGVLGSACILFTRSMYESLGIRYATLLLAGVALLGCFVPFFFKCRGRIIREKGLWCWKEDS